MPATKQNARVAAAFQGGKDPQQDLILQWLGTLPTDERGGIRRSVMKYHLTQALLLYIHHSSQSGGKSVSVPIPSLKDTVPVSPPVTPVSSPVSMPVSSPIASTMSSPGAAAGAAKGPNRALRAKIAGSMASAK